MRGGESGAPQVTLKASVGACDGLALGSMGREGGVRFGLC